MMRDPSSLLYRTAKLEANLESVAKQFDRIEKYNPNHVSSGAKGGEFTSGKGGKGLVGGKYQSGSAMGLAFSLLEDGHPKDLNAILDAIKSKHDTKDPLGRINWIKKHGEENGEWTVKINKQAGTVQLTKTQYAPGYEPGGVKFTPKEQFKDYSGDSSASSRYDFSQTAGKQLAKKLTLDEADALASYTLHKYAPLNASLRSQAGVLQLPQNDPSSKLAVHLTTALRKAVIPEDIVVYRGTQGSLSQGLAPGSILVDHGFMSTSLNASTARGFSKGAILKIDVPKGHNAAVLGQLSEHLPESEVLFPRGSMFKVISITPQISTVIGPTIHVVAI